MASPGPEWLSAVSLCERPTCCERADQRGPARSCAGLGLCPGFRAWRPDSTCDVASALVRRREGWLVRRVLHRLAGRNLALSSVPWSAISELIVFSYGPNSDGTLNTTDHGLTPALQSAAVAAAHQHGRLALISIEGAEFQTVSEGACSSANRAVFVNNTISQMRTYGYDGVDLDVEHDRGGPSHPDYVACIQAMRNGLDQVSTALGKRPLLTEPCDPSWQSYMCTEVKQFLDQINMMGYGSDCTVGNCSQVAKDISNMTSDGVPENLIGIGIGVDPGMPAATAPHSTVVCSSTAQYAIAHGIGGSWSGRPKMMRRTTRVKLRVSTASLRT
jgi:Glycosyl hydrolases family 18